LGRNDLAREQIKNYLLTSIATKQNVTQFERGLRNIITTTKDVNGAITGYWMQYAFDTYAKVREVDNLHFADELKLNYFIYQGGIIKTSRAFCIRKNGKVFSRDEALRDWPKDSTLIDQKHLASYKPLIDRGRNNCRHFLMWITDERANELKGTQ
jgi:predicted small secreted protein